MTTRRFMDDYAFISRDKKEFEEELQIVAENSGFKEINVEGIRFPATDIGIFAGNILADIRANRSDVFGYKIDPDDEEAFVSVIEKSSHTLVYKGRKMYFSVNGEKSFVERSGAHSRGYRNLVSTDRQNQVEKNCQATKETVLLRHSFGLVTGVLSKDYKIIPQEQIFNKLYSKKDIEFVSGSLTHEYMRTDFNFSSEYTGSLQTSDIGMSSVIMVIYGEEDGVRYPVLNALEMRHIGDADITAFDVALDRVEGLLKQKEEVIETLKKTPVVHKENAAFNLGTYLDVKDEIKNNFAFLLSMNTEATLWDLYVAGAYMIQENGADKENKEKRLLNTLTGSFSWKEFDTLAKFSR